MPRRDVAAAVTVVTVVIIAGIIVCRSIMSMTTVCFSKGAGSRGLLLRDLWRLATVTPRMHYFGNKINFASAESFQVSGYGYARDSWNVYYNGVKINGASADSFRVLNDGYAKDAWNVYFDGVKINGAMADSFSCGPDGYAHDTWNTYYYGRKIK